MLSPQVGAIGFFSPTLKLHFMCTMVLLLLIQMIKTFGAMAGGVVEACSLQPLGQYVTHAGIGYALISHVPAHFRCVKDADADFWQRSPFSRAHMLTHARTRARSFELTCLK